MRFRISLLTLVLIAGSSIATACSVPVFRYALEHWLPDSYVAYVLHHGPLNSAVMQQIENLQAQGLDGRSTVNLLVKSIDVTEPQSLDLQQIVDEYQGDEFPWLVLKTPSKIRPAVSVWEGELTEAHAALIMQSPARATIQKQLIAGDSVVWVFLENGRKEVDDPAYALLGSEIERLESQLKLPPVAEEDLGELSIDSTAMKVAFSALRISRDDPQEKAFVELLLSVEPDLKDIELIGQPMVFPIFGRGRALYALVGEGISSELIEEAGRFLTGACQCTVKAENPGTDLIMHFDWDRYVIPTQKLDEELPPLAGFSGFSGTDEMESLTVLTSSTSSSEEPEPPASEAVELPVLPEGLGAQAGETSGLSDHMAKNVLVMLVVLVVAVAVGSVVFAPKAS